MSAWARGVFSLTSRKRLEPARPWLDRAAFVRKSAVQRLFDTPSRARTISMLSRHIPVANSARGS